MFGIGESELVIIVVFGFLLFGPDKLPGMGRTIGRALRQFRDAQADFTQVVQAEVMDPLNETLNAPGKEAARAAVDDDGDFEGSDSEMAARKSETFAERKARLQAERKAKEEAERAAQEEAEAQEEKPAEQGEAEGSQAEGSQKEAEDKAEAAPEPAAKAEEEAPADNSVAALYSLTPRKKAPKPQPEVKPTEEAEPSAETASQPSAEEAPAAAAKPAPAAAPQTDAKLEKEDGSEA